MMTWEEVKQSWSDGWRYLAREAEGLYDSIMSDPDAYKDDVESFVTELEASRRNLDAIKAKLPKHPKTEEEKAQLKNYFDLEDRYHELAAGLYSDAEPAQQATVGIIPILIVAGLAVGVAGTAWGVASYEYAVNLREQTELASKELDARVKASEEGRTLQASTLPPPPEPPSSPLDFANPSKAVKGVGTLLVGGLVVAAGALVIPQLIKRR